MASIFQRNGIWWIQYYDRGRRIRKSLNTTLKTEARREKTAIEAKLLEPTRNAKPERNARVEEFWPEYLSWCAFRRLRHPYPKEPDRVVRRKAPGRSL